MQDFRTLLVWQKAHALTLAIYRATASFPRNEMYGLVRQVRRSSSSVPTNIVEGCGYSSGNFGRFLQIAAGTACETEYHLILATDLGYLPVERSPELIRDVHEIKRMLTSLMLRVQNSKTEN